MLDNRRKGCFVALSHFLWVGLIWHVGCVSTDILNRKVDLVENEIADVTQENRRLQQRMDELQIQLSQVMTKLKTLSEQATWQKTPENSNPQAQKSHHSKSDAKQPLLGGTTDHTDTHRVDSIR